MSRVKVGIQNIVVAFIGQFVGILSNFISRIIFVKIFTSEYLGLNGLFTNILSMLSLAELGFGTAITFSLYEPLAKKDKEQIKSIMSLFKKIYRIVGFAILFIGALLTPFLSSFIKEIPDIDNIELIYILFVINTAFSYFYSYKRTLIIADQNRYIATIYRYTCYVMMNILQIIVILITKNYILYLLTQILFTVIENILSSKKANKMYPYLKDKKISPITNDVKKDIVKNTKAMMMNKIGSIVVSSTDSIIISKFLGLVATGIYSNYSLITQALKIITDQIYNSLAASIGNLCASKNEEYQYNIFKRMNFMTFWIFYFSSICLMTLLSTFITLWLGADYLFSELTTLMIVTVFYITGMRRPVVTYREAKGIFYKDRYKSVLEAISNLVISIILVQKYGVVGVFLGTIISSLIFCVWIEALVLFKDGFNINPIYYFKEYLKYTLFTILVGLIVYYICYFIKVDNLIILLLVKLFICITIPNIIFYIVFRKNDEFKYFKNLLKDILSKLTKKIFKNGDILNER